KSEVRRPIATSVEQPASGLPEPPGFRRLSGCRATCNGGHFPAIIIGICCGKVWFGMPTYVFESRSPEETGRLARELAERLAPGSVLALEGDQIGRASCRGREWVSLRCGPCEANELA